MSQAKSASGDFTVGGATGQGGDFSARDLRDYRLALSFRFPRDSMVGGFLDVWGNVLVHTDCPLSGSCDGDYPELVGGGFMLGGIIKPRRNAELRLGFGPGIFNVANTHYNGAAIGLISQVDLAYFPMKHVGIVGGNRFTVVRVSLASAGGTTCSCEPRGETLRVAPWIVGLRVR